VKLNSNRSVGLFFLLLGLFIFLAVPYQIGIGNTQYGPRLFPQIVSLIMIFCSLVLLLLDFKSRKNWENIKKGDDQSSNGGDRPTLFKSGEFPKAIIVFAIMTAYIYSIEIIGFFLSSILFGVIMLIFYRTQKWYHYGIVLGLTVLIYLIFTYLLLVQLP